MTLDRLARGSWLLTPGFGARVIRAFLVLVAPCILVVASGCTSRGMTITSEPPGSEVSINRRVVGTTPLRVGYTHYGTYRIEIRKFGYDVLVREEELKPPIYGYDPVAAVADNLAPARLDDEIYLHYVLKQHGPNGTKAEKADAGKADAESGTNVSSNSEPTDEKSIADRAAANKASLLARATAARGGTVTHPRTGETVQVAIGPEQNKKPKAVNEADVPVIIGDSYATVGPSLTPNLEVPTALAPLRTIDAEKPQGPSLGEKYGIVSDSTDAGVFVKPNEAKKPAQPVAPLRTPKDEELIYDQPKLTDPTQKKK